MRRTGQPERCRPPREPRPAAASRVCAGSAQRPPPLREPRLPLGWPSTRARSASIRTRLRSDTRRDRRTFAGLPWIECRGLATRAYLRFSSPPPTRPSPGRDPWSRARDFAAPGARGARKLPHPEERRLSERRLDREPLQDHPVPRDRRVRDRRGRARLLDLQVPRQEEPRSRPRSTATPGWRSVGRSRRR